MTVVGRGVHEVCLLVPKNSAADLVIDAHAVTACDHFLTLIRTRTGQQENILVLSWYALHHSHFPAALHNPICAT